MALLDGKVAIITGASKGIGRALSLRFAQEKAAVVCAARSAGLVRETAELVGKAGGKIQGNRHIKVEKPTPLSNVWTSVIELAGIPTEKYAESNGRVEL